MTLILVRHAESTGNSGGTIQGWTDTELTEVGRAQAVAVAQRLAAMSPVAIYSSPLARARETADAVAQVSGLAAVELDDLRERYYGQAQGLTWTEASVRWPAQAAHDRDWATAVPDVESLAALRARAVAVVSGLMNQHRDDVAVCVSHGGTLVQVIAHLFGLPVDVWPRIRMSNTSVTIVEGPAEQPLVRTLNDICHLEDRERASTLAL
ncbi:MAG: histidine phosphatase family protein [Dehalococcoidia bacterium]|nr:histidine phosphatase family protein [Dehalococcoidia bacterium]